MWILHERIPFSRCFLDVENFDLKEEGLAREGMIEVENNRVPSDLCHARVNSLAARVSALKLGPHHARYFGDVLVVNFAECRGIHDAVASFRRHGNGFRFSHRQPFQSALQSGDDLLRALRVGQWFSTHVGIDDGLVFQPQRVFDRDFLAR